MGSVVTRSVPDFHLVMGNPARFAGYVCRCGEPPGAEGRWRTGRRFLPLSRLRLDLPGTRGIVSESSQLELLPVVSNIGDWAIVGGGLLGMTMAHTLSKLGRKVTLLESSANLGGLASAWRIRRYRLGTATIM